VGCTKKSFSTCVYPGHLDLTIIYHILKTWNPSWLRCCNEVVIRCYKILESQKHNFFWSLWEKAVMNKKKDYGFPGCYKYLEVALRCISLMFAALHLIHVPMSFCYRKNYALPCWEVSCPGEARPSHNTRWHMLPRPAVAPVQWAPGFVICYSNGGFHFKGVPQIIHL
jgi:hypothetical protein